MMTIGHKPSLYVLLHVRVYELSHSTFEVNWLQVRFVRDSLRIFSTLSMPDSGDDRE
jgi:hypothetical protein